MAGRQGPTRRSIVCAFGASGLGACCWHSVSGSRDLLSRLADQSRQRGLGISYLGTGLLHTRYFSDPEDITEIGIPERVTLGQPAILLDWGHALVVEDVHALRVMDLVGTPIGEAKCDVYVHGCVLHKDRRQLLYWGQQALAMLRYGCYVADLSSGRTSTVFELQLRSEFPPPAMAGSFAGRDPRVVDLSCGFKTYRIQTDVGVLAEQSSPLEVVEESPDGRHRAGRTREGAVALVDRDSSTTASTGISSIGRVRWDPSSRYVLAERLTHAMPLCARTEIVVIDAVTREHLTMPGLVGDERAHHYEWVLLPVLAPK